VGRPAGDVDNCLNNVCTGERACHYSGSKRHYAHYHRCRNYYHDNHHNQRQ